MPISALTAVINDHEIELDENTLILTSVHPSEHSLIEDTLRGAGYRIDERRTIRSNNVYIELTARYWEHDCPIHRAWEQLFELALVTSKLPEDPIVLEHAQLLQCSEALEYKRIKIALELRAVLVQLSDLCEPKEGDSKGRDKLHYLVPLDDRSAKFDFSPRTTWEKLVTIDNVDDCLSAINKLHKALSVGDSQDDERRNVMRSALCELMDSSGSEEIFFHLLRSSPKLLDKYNEYHEVFVQRFSVNKVLREINEKNLSYNQKIRDAISSSQVKALTIPAALVVIGAAMRLNSAIDAVAVAVGLFISTLIVHKGLNVYSEAVIQLRDQVTDDFGIYNSFAEKAEIRVKANSSRQNLITALDKADGNLRFVRWSLWGTFVATIVYIVTTVALIGSTTSATMLDTQKNQLFKLNSVPRKKTELAEPNTVSTKVKPKADAELPEQGSSIEPIAPE